MRQLLFLGYHRRPAAHSAHFTRRIVCWMSPCHVFYMWTVTREEYHSWTRTRTEEMMTLIDSALDPCTGKPAEYILF